MVMATKATVTGIGVEEIPRKSGRRATQIRGGKDVLIASWECEIPVRKRTGRDATTYQPPITATSGHQHQRNTQTNTHTLPRTKYSFHIIQQEDHPDWPSSYSIKSLSWYVRMKEYVVPTRFMVIVLVFGLMFDSISWCALSVRSLGERSKPCSSNGASSWKYATRIVWS